MYCRFWNYNDLCVVHANKLNISTIDTIKILGFYCPTCFEHHLIIQGYHSFGIHGMCEILTP